MGPINLVTLIQMNTALRVKIWSGFCSFSNLMIGGTFSKPSFSNIVILLPYNLLVAALDPTNLTFNHFLFCRHRIIPLTKFIIYSRTTIFTSHQPALSPQPPPRPPKSIGEFHPSTIHQLRKPKKRKLSSRK